MYEAAWGPFCVWVVCLTIWKIKLTIFSHARHARMNRGIYVIVYTYLYMCGPKSWGQRVLRTKKKGPTTMNLSVTLSFCWHTHSHAAGHPVVYVCEKSLPQWRRSFLVVVAVVAPLFCLIIYMSKQLRVQFSSLALVMSCGGNFFIYLWCPQICAV